MTRESPFAARRHGFQTAALFLLLAPGFVGTARAQTFTELSSTPSTNQFLDLYYQSRLSGNGSTVTGTVDTYNSAGTTITGSQAVTLTGGSSTPTGLGYLTGETSSFGFGISSSGSTVVGASSNGTGTAAVATEWTGGAATGLGTLSGYTNSVAYSVSDNGVVTGLLSNNTAGGATQVFRWTSGGGMTTLGALPGGYSDTSLGGANANTISSDGSVIAGNLSSATGALPTQAFRWTSAGGVAALGVQTGGSYSFASALSSDGNTVIGYGDNANGQQEAYRWSSSTGMSGLGMAYGTLQTNASAANASTSLIVGDYFHSASNGSTDYSSGYIYSASYGYADVKDYFENSLGLSGALANWTDIDALDISGDGTTIIGDGLDASGNYAYWKVTDANKFTEGYTESAGLIGILAPYGGTAETPEPGTLALLLPFAAPCALGIVRRRKARSARMG